MRIFTSSIAFCVISVMTLVLSSCATSTNGINSSSSTYTRTASDAPKTSLSSNYASRLPSHINTGEKTVLIDPTVHAWGAYNQSGNLERAGLAVAGSDWCPDIGRRCHTSSGSFRVNSLGQAGCKSTIYPRPRGGAPMPYCMFFNKNQAMHGTPESHLAEANLSHGCVRLHVSDAEWLRFNFVNVGTKVVVKPY